MRVPWLQLKPWKQIQSFSLYHTTLSFRLLCAVHSFESFYMVNIFEICKISFEPNLSIASVVCRVCDLGNYSTYLFLFPSETKVFHLQILTAVIYL